MASHSLLTVSNSQATRVSPFGLHSGVDLTIQNVNTEGYIYVGGSDEVTSLDYGYRIAPNNAISFELPGKDALYVIASTNGLSVAVMMTNLDSGS